MDGAVRDRILGRLARAGLSPPKTLTLMITGDCNLRCLHCWPECRPHETPAFVSTGKLKGVLKEWAGLGLEEICLTGGEPLTHPDWLEILGFACGLPGLQRIRLQTNATLLGAREAKALASIGFKGLVVQVSLEGATASSNDRVRGSGSFESAWQGLKFLSEAGLGGQTVVAFTEARHNFGELPALLEMLDQLAIGSLVSGTLVQGGRAAKTSRLAPPTPSQYQEILDRYCADAGFRERYQRIGNIAALEWLRGGFESHSEQCACIEIPYITAEDRIYPCRMLPIEKYAVRGVFERPLEETLAEAIPLWSELPELRQRRSVELEECNACPGRLHCAGGCLGRAYTSSGDPMTVEDRCALRKSVYLWKPPSGSKL